jgi:hypothetical protein
VRLLPQLVIDVLPPRRGRAAEGAGRMSAWRVRATAVRAHQLGLRWTLEARTDDVEVTVTADTTRGGQVYDLQSDGYVNGTGDEALDWEVAQHIADTLALRAVLSQLDAIGRGRQGRADRLRWTR